MKGRNKTLIKLVVLSTLTLSCLDSRAQNVVKINSSDHREIVKVKKFLEKTGKCEYAATSFPDNSKYRDAHAIVRVDCITDVTLNEGTINEKSGCAYVKFNVEKNQMESPYNGSMKPTTVVGKKCGEPGVFTKLINTPVLPWKKEDTVGSRLNNHFAKFSTIVLYSKKREYIDAAAKYDSK